MRKEYMLLLFLRRPKTQINSIDDKWIKLRQNEYEVSFQKPKKDIPSRGKTSTLFAKRIDSLHIFHAKWRLNAAS